MKKIFFAIIGILLIQTAKAQSQEAMSKYNNKFDLFAYGAANRIFCDLSTVDLTGGAGIGFGVRVHNYIRLVGDLQYGLYKGGNKNDRGQYYMEFKNRYTSFNVMARFYPFLLPYSKVDALDRLYLAAGPGLHFNNVKANSSNIAGVGYLDDNTNVDFYIPMEAGYSFPVYKWGLLPGNNYGKSINVTLAFRYNLSFSDTWDGYTPQVDANQHNDASCNIMLGVGYSF